VTAQEHALRASEYAERADEHARTGALAYRSADQAAALSHALTAIALSFASDPGGTIGDRIDWLTSAVQR
jgi:hypothetical protein